MVFIEVRCKRTEAFGSPAESITLPKRRRLVSTAQHYLHERGLEEVDCRFDVVEVTSAGGKLIVSDVIRDAFGA
jgi:putative endonuclease